MNNYLKRYEICALEKAAKEAIEADIASVQIEPHSLMRLLREVKKRRFQSSRHRHQNQEPKENL